MELGGKYLTEVELKDMGFRKLGRNVKIHSRSSIYGVENISIGDNVRIDDFTVIVASGHLDIGSHVQITNFCYLGAKYGIRLEDFVGIGCGTRIYTSSDDYYGEKLTNITVPSEFTGGIKGRVVLQKHVIVGANCVILPACTIGEGAAIGALSLVVKDIEPWGIYCGIPVKRLRARKRDLLLLERELKEEEGHKT